MSGMQRGNGAREMCLKYRNNFDWGTTYQVHMPHVAAYVVRYVVGHRRGTERSRNREIENPKNQNLEN